MWLYFCFLLINVISVNTVKVIILVKCKTIKNLKIFCEVEMLYLQAMQENKNIVK